MSELIVVTKISIEIHEQILARHTDLLDIEVRQSCTLSTCLGHSDWHLSRTLHYGHN